MQPERRRQRRRLGHYAADGLSARGDELIGSKFAAIGDAFTPAKQIAIELNRALAIVSEKLVPTDLAASSGVAGASVRGLSQLIKANTAFIGRRRPAKRLMSPILVGGM